MKRYFLFLSLSALAATAFAESRLPEADKAFWESKREMLTAVWQQPFSYESIRSKHAPLGPYMGNGDIGCVAYTAYNSQTLLVSKVDFVTDGWSDWAGSGAAALPAGGVRISVDSPEGPGFDYRMKMLSNKMDMTTGTQSPVQMSSWLSVGKNYLVTELSTTSREPVRISVETYAGGNTGIYGKTARTQSRIAQVTRRTKTDNVEWISQVGLSTAIVGAENEASVVADSLVRHTFWLSPEAKTYVVTLVSGGGMDDNARLPEAYSRLKKISEKRISKLRQEKDRWWQDMWNRSYVETGDSLLDRHYLSSIYLLASAYNEHSPVCGGMYGVWNMDDQMNYHGDIHLNYNSQAGFYSVFSANRPELALPFYEFIEKMVPEGKRRAREDMASVHPSLKGKSCRGVLFPVSALGIGRFYGPYWQQTMDAPFNVPLFSWYYEYTGDRDFLKNRTYPFIRECGDFYEDYLTKEPWGNSYRYSIITGGHENSWDLNPPSDLAFVDLTFRLLLKYSNILDVDADRRAKWQDILTHLPGYKVIMPTKKPNEGLPVYAKNEDGWDAPSHLIQLHALYPCEVMNLNSDPDSLQIARNTIYYYGVSQNGLTGTMNELGLSAFVMGARAGFDPDILIDKMKYLIAGAGKNLLITDGHHCLEKTAVVETVNSMMLQSVDDVLWLFPDWPARPASFTRLRAKGGFLVSARYDGTQVESCQIQPTVNGRCQFRNPWKGQPVRVCDERGREVALSVEKDICSFEAKAGRSYTISQRADE